MHSFYQSTGIFLWYF